MHSTSFNELHLFIDETGKLISDDALNAVGGVIFFGRYDSNTDQELKEVLSRHLAEAGGAFPSDLHYSQSNLTYAQLDQCLQGIGAELHDTFENRPLQSIYGVSIAHDAAIFTDSGNLLLDENKRDNRYLTLIWALIEYITFVDPVISKSLAPDWTLHLHIASRSIELRTNQSRERKAFENANYHVQPMLDGKPVSNNAKPTGYLVHRPLNVRDLENMLRTAQQVRWNDRPVTVRSLDVQSINYKQPGSLAGLYLADLYLGQFRSARLRKRPITLLTPKFELSFGPWLKTIADMAEAVTNQALDAYLSLREEFDGYDHPGAAELTEFVQHFDMQMAPLLQRNPERLEKELLEAARQVDESGQSTRSFQRARRAYDYLEAAQAVRPRARHLYFQTRHSHANHTGHTEEAEAIWREYEHFVDEGEHSALEHFLLDAELRNRRAVALTDQFRPEDAVEVLIPVIERQDEAAELFGDAPFKESIGACYGTMGQAEAFCGHLDSAHSFFRQALTYFDRPADRERQLVYLGHVACDMPPAQGQKIWAGVLDELNSLTGAQHAVSGSQYVLAIYLKSCLVFSSPTTLLNELEAWQGDNLFSHFTAEDRDHHPFGLIYQTLAMCHDRLIRSELNVDIDHYLQKARLYYDRAAEHMNTGGPLLQLLSLGASLRKELLLVHTKEHNPEGLGRVFNAFRAHLQAFFGAAAWNEQEDGTSTGYFGRHDPGPGSWIRRSESVLRAIRFNYW